MSVDLESYFRRIGYSGSRAPTLETLRAINRLHPQAIAFENLDPLMGRPVELDAGSLERKLVREGRGGYCYEHNLLFGHVLEALGFRVRYLAARVIWGRPSDAPAPLLHNLLRIELDRVSHVVDVGFGVATPTAPLRLEAGVEQPTPHETCRLVEAGEELIVEVRIGRSWVALYRFDLQEQSLADYEVGNWYASTHPSSRFVNDLMAARADVDGRHALRNNAYAVHSLAGGTSRRTLESAAELRAVLGDAFRIRVPETEEFDEWFERIVRRTD